MEEMWVDVPKFPGYQVSNRGQVQSCRPGHNNCNGNGYRLLKTCRDGISGHLKVTLYDGVGGKQGKQKKVHQLVLEAFVGPCPPGMECLHENDIGSDNRLENLSWGTRSQNVKDAQRNGKKHQYKKYTDELVMEVKRRLTNGEKAVRISEELGISQPMISQIRNGKYRTQVTI